MAEWRRIDKKVFHDKKFMRLSFGARILFVGMITIADDEGYSDADPSVLKAQVFPGDEIPLHQVEEWRSEIHKLGLVKLWSRSVDIFYSLPNWLRYQTPSRDNRGKRNLMSKDGLCEVGSTAVRNGAARGPDEVPTVHTVHTEQKNKSDKNIPAQNAAPDSVDKSGLGDRERAEESSSVKPSPRPTKSIAKQVNDADNDDIRLEWQRRFPGGPDLIPSLAQSLLSICENAWIDPRWIVSRVLVTADDPIAYLIRVMKSKPLSSPPDDERSAWTWAKWQSRPRANPVGQTVGQVLFNAMQNASGGQSAVTALPEAARESVT